MYANTIGCYHLVAFHRGLRGVDSCVAAQREGLQTIRSRGFAAHVETTLS